MNDKVMVQNLTNDKVVYIDNDGGVERRILFNPQEEKPISRAMVERMRYDIGGSVLLRDYLSVKDDDIRVDIGVPSDQIEYDYTEQDVINLFNDNNVDAIADALDFGPQAIKDMIADKAVSLPTDNRNIMTLISAKTGKNIEAMIRNAEIYAKANPKEDKSDNTPSGRRVQVNKKTDEPAGRRVQNVNGQDLVIPEKK